MKISALRRSALAGASLFFLFFSYSTQAAPVIFSGYDSSPGATTNADSAAAQWSSSVSGVVTDQLQGISGTTSSLTSSLGNVFNQVNNGTLTPFNYCCVAGVVEFDHFYLTNTINDFATYSWVLQDPSDALSFFTYSLNGGTLNIELGDGINSFNFSTGPLNPGGTTQDSLFWGISDVPFTVTTVTLSTDDGGAGTTSNWDRFSTANSSVVPVPAAAWLFCSALIGLAGLKRRK